MHLSISFIPICGSKDLTHFKICLLFEQSSEVVNFPQAYGPRSHVRLRFCLTLGLMSKVVNFP